MADALHALTALGERTPRSLTIGPVRIRERFDVALASLACRKDREEDFARAAAAAAVPLPGPGAWLPADPWSAFWVSPGMWFVEAPFDSHEDVVAHLKPVFGTTASITEQTDAWVRFDLDAPAPARLLERLCNVDVPTRPMGFATRTVIEHLGCYLVKRGEREVTLYGPRSSAASLLHALEAAAAALA